MALRIICGVTTETAAVWSSKVSLCPCSARTLQKGILTPMRPQPQPSEHSSKLLQNKWTWTPSNSSIRQIANVRTDNNHTAFGGAFSCWCLSVCSSVNCRKHWFATNTKFIPVNYECPQTWKLLSNPWNMRKSFCYCSNAGVAKLRLFETLHPALWAFWKIIYLFFIATAKCRNIVKWYCGS